MSTSASKVVEVMEMVSDCKVELLDISVVLSLIVLVVMIALAMWLDCRLFHWSEEIKTRELKEARLVKLEADRMITDLLAFNKRNK